MVLPIQSVHITTNDVSFNPLRRGVLDTTLCDKLCQWLTAGQWFSLGTPVFQPIKLTAMITGVPRIVWYNIMLNENWLVEWESWFVCQYINWNLTFKVQMYLICFQIYMIVCIYTSFMSDLRQGSDFLWVLRFFNQ
jgi:hypothetical protein